MHGRERIAVAAGIFEHRINADARHQFEARHFAGGAFGRECEQLQRFLGRCETDIGGFDRARTRQQFQHGGGDHPERAFRADEQVFQVVAGIVLFQLVEIVQDAAVGQHHFEPERECARNAVSQRRRAAGIGREIAADGAGALRRQQQRIEPVDGLRGGARIHQRDAGFAGDGVRHRIDFPDLVEAVERQQDLALMRDLTPDETRVPALRHDGDAVVVRELENPAHFIDRARPQHHRRGAAIDVAHLRDIRHLRVGAGDGEFVTHDRGEARDQRIRRSFHFVEHQCVRKNVWNGFSVAAMAFLLGPVITTCST